MYILLINISNVFAKKSINKVIMKQFQHSMLTLIVDRHQTNEPFAAFFETPSGCFTLNQFAILRKECILNETFCFSQVLFLECRFTFV